MNKITNVDEVETAFQRVVAPPLPFTEPLWTVDEVARYLRLDPETVRGMARNGRLPAFKVGRGWRFRATALKEYFSHDLGEKNVR